MNVQKNEVKSNFREGIYGNVTTVVVAFIYSPKAGNIFTNIY